MGSNEPTIREVRNILDGWADDLSPDETAELVHAVIVETQGELLIRTKAWQQILSTVVNISSRQSALNYRERAQLLGLAEPVERGLRILDVPTEYRERVREALDKAEATT